MKQSVKLFIVILLLLSGCASVSPVGNWNYTVTETPNGNYSGTMTVTKEKSAYAAVMKGDAGEIPFRNFTYDPKTKKTSGNFDFQGTTINFDGSVTPATIEGSMSADGMKFPFKATRQK